jgi:hypothetical protein
MKKIYTVLAFAFIAAPVFSQNPGLVISEVLANPPGTDNSFEWVELVATQSIDFSVTPYSVVVCNNGNATANGWVSGGALSYGFSITTGTVNAGDVVYVGGSTMLPTGTKLRVIDVVTTPGDGFGAAAAGVFGNGGTNVDGIAVFNLPIASLTNSSVPVDALFYGTGIGSAVVNAGADGYQLPVNDLYAGGKLQTTSFFAGDPGSDITIKATGAFNTATNAWAGQRSWSTQAAVNDNTSAVQLVTVNPPGTIAITGTTQTVSETAGTVTVNVTMANANASDAKVAFALSTYTNATQGADFSWASDTLTIPAGTNGTVPFTIQLTDDLLSERTERIILKLSGAVNATIAGNSFQIIYLTDNDYVAPTPSNELQLSLLTSFNNGAEGTNSAEIVAYDSTTYRLYIANSIGAKLDIVNFANPSAPVLLSSIPMTPYGNINSLAVYNGIVAAAVENSNPQLNGSVVFFDANGVFLNQVTVGAMPDMITFNRNNTKVVVACEGEPKSDYSIDPEGSVAIIDLTPGIAALTNANVSIASFAPYNGQEATLRSQGIRIFGPGSSAAQDFEPEYITIADDNQTAYVALQENNAMAVVNLNTATVTAIRPLGLMDYSSGNGMDASDQTAGVYITSLPVKGTFMPDALAHATIGGQEYIFSANEGDAREYTAITDVARISATSLDATVFPDQNILKNNQFLGRLNVLQATGDTDNDGDKDEIHVLGTRSFSIWNAATGALVFDSKDLIEQITSHHPTLSNLFNASNTSGAAAAKNRSDDKGPEPEGVATAFINGNHYLFVSLERVGGVLAFNIDNPAVPVYSGYYNNRTFAANGPDRGAEGIIYISKAASPNNEEIVILANEVSSTLSVFQVNTCVELAGATITALEDSICAGTTTTLSIPGNAQSTVQWFHNGTAMPGQNGNSITASQAGNYRVYVSNSALACADTTVNTAIAVNPLPVVGAGANQSVCAGTSVTLAGSGAQAYTWTNGITDNTAFTPGATATYTVTGTDANGCTDTEDVLVTVNNLPVVIAGTDLQVCAGETVTLAGSGAQTYQWDNNVTDDVAFTPAATATYIVTGTDTNNCENTDTLTVTINDLPAVNAGNDITICEGQQTVLGVSGSDDYTWNNNVTNGTPFVPVATQDYIVTATDTNNCENTDTVTVTVHDLPVLDAGNDITICEGQQTVLGVNGSDDYTWNNNVTNGTPFTPVTTQDYIVTATTLNGCTDSDTVTVTVNELPSVDLGNDTTTCVNYGPVVLDAGAGFTAYSWSTTATTQTISVTQTGSYTATVTGANGCQNSDVIVVTVDPCLGLTEQTIAMTLFPNPTENIVTIHSTGTAPMVVQVRTISGELLFTTEHSVIDLSALASGTYLLQVTQGTAQQVFRVEKIH